MAKQPKLKFTEQKEEVNLVRLDLGTGKGEKCPEGYVGVDLIKAPGVKQVDLRLRWPWSANSVDAVHCDYLLQYFTAAERVHFMNELHRVLRPGAQAVVITPYWCASRAYMDIMVQSPPVAEGWYYTLSKEWRESQNYTDRSGLKCDFDCGVGYGMHALILPKNQEYQQHAVMFWKEAAQDLHVTLTKK